MVIRVYRYLLINFESYLFYILNKKLIIEYFFYFMYGNYKIISWNIIVNERLEVTFIEN